jgi:large subunit ribosomal protein L22
MARAILRRFRESPRKVRAVADMIRGRSVEDAMSILRMQQRKAARMLSKVLGSAIANATENEKADSDKLIVTKVFIDGGPVQKRWMARSMGRANRINARTSHVTVVVDVPE